MTITSSICQMKLATNYITKIKKYTLLTFLLTAALFFSVSSQAIEVDSERSIFIRDVSILQQFSLTETLQKVIDDSGDFANTPQSILDTWPATRSEGCGFGEIFNGFPFGCMSGHGNVMNYKTLALVNRFDLAKEDGTDCGEYRIAFSNTQAASGTLRVKFAIFEARLVNPNPQNGLQGCLPVAKFWSDLSHVDDIDERAERLYDFYFKGLPGFTAIVDVNNYRGGENDSGQIRFNERISSGCCSSWNFFEFRTRPSPGNLSFALSTVKDTPPMTLLSDTTPISVLQDFEEAILQGLTEPGKNLLASTMGTLAFDPPNTINAGNTAADLDDVENGFDNLKSSFDKQSELANNIQTQLTAVGSNLTPEQVIARVDALSCVGCHSQAADLGGPINFTSTGQFIEMLSVDPELGESIRIEAESFNEMSGVKTEVTSDTGNGQNVGWLDADDWMVYNVALPVSTTALYRVSFRIAGTSRGKLVIEQPGGSQTWQTVNIPSTGGWQSWRTVVRIVEIPTDQTGFAITVQEGGWNINWIEIESLGGEKMKLKDVLRNEFIPERKIILENFINSACTSFACQDSDNDSVNDDIDQCPNTAAETNVNESGCPVLTGSPCDGVTAYPNWLHNDYDGGPNTHINAGELMQHNNQLFQANWYASSLPGSDSSWTSLGGCD